MRWHKWAICILLAVVCARPSQGGAETIVRANINFTYAKTSKHHSHEIARNAVIWLTPVSTLTMHRNDPIHPGSFRLEQKNKEFIPHLLVVPTGSLISFPNLDPFFHNVFSLFNGKRFYLGLYEKGQSRTVKFDHPGVSYIFCDIHPEMSAVVITLSTPYYAMASPSGNIRIPDVPPGEYDLNVWAEGVSETQLAALSRRIKVTSPELNLGDISVTENPIATHKNKFGEDYLKQTTPPY